MKPIKWFVLALFAAIVISCGSGNGKLHKVGNLEIYYSKEIQIEYVKSLGIFFKENKLIHPSQVHSVKLTSNSDSFVLKMILNDSLKSVPDSKLKEIAFLEEAIGTNVFKNRNFVIEITDSYFNPIIVR
ncbi:MAG: hypothetical protein AB8B74_06205 [Crocinitomicaceae bacterium]